MLRYGLLGSETNVITRSDGLIIQTDTADLQELAMQAHEAWFANPTETTKQTFAAALRRWGRAAGKRDAVEHAEKLMRGEL